MKDRTNEKNMLLGLSFVDPKFVEESETQTLATKKDTGRKLFRKPLLVAAIVTAMVFLMGCAAAIAFQLENLKLAEETYEAPMRYQENGETIPSTEKTLNWISLVGLEESANVQAMQEWQQYRESAPKADPGYQPPHEYLRYGVSSEQMKDKLDQLCEKYNLKLAGRGEIAQRSEDEAYFYETLGIDGIFQKNAPVAAEYGGSIFWETGKFNASYNLRLTDKKAKMTDSFMLSYNYCGKDVFNLDMLVIEDAASVEQWPLTLADGTQVLMVSEKGDSVHILCDREDAFIGVELSNVGSNWDSPSDVMTREDLEMVAQSLDFQLKPKPVADMDAVAAHLAASRAEEDTPDPQKEAKRKQDYDSHVRHDSYGDLVSCIREDEAYFVSNISSDFENFGKTGEYALLDVTGDGQEELILGRDGQIVTIWTMRDGKTFQITGSGYLCEGEVFEVYHFVDGKPYHMYLEGVPGSQSYFEKLLYQVEYTTDRGWLLYEGYDNMDGKEITEEQAKKIIASHPRRTLTMTAIEKFPMT